jgi:hypothetical protein
VAWSVSSYCFAMRKVLIPRMCRKPSSGATTVDIEERMVTRKTVCAKLKNPYVRLESPNVVSRRVAKGSRHRDL